MSDFSYYKDIDYYDNKVEQNGNTVSSTTVVDYKKVDINKIIEIEGKDDKIVDLRSFKEYENIYFDEMNIDTIIIDKYLIENIDMLYSVNGNNLTITPTTNGTITLTMTKKMPYQDNISALIHEISFRNILDAKLFPQIKYIIKLGNRPTNVRARFTI